MTYVMFDDCSPLQPSLGLVLVQFSQRLVVPHLSKLMNPSLEQVLRNRLQRKRKVTVFYA